MYSPFPGSKRSEFVIDDLKALLTQGVAEGLFVEYKSELVKPAKIANSLASFANSYGGWYIVGIEADTIANRAVSISGMSLADSRDPVATIREAAKEYLSPTPIFYTDIVDIGDNRVVAIVCVPEWQDKPIVSRDGRIYRRIADASDPTFEKDRHIIDRLVNEGREHSRRFDEFCSDNREFCQAEEGHPWLHVYIRPNPDWLEKYPSTSLADLEELLAFCNEPIPIPLGEANDITCNIPFDTIRTGPGCVIVGSVVDRPAHLNHLAIEFHGRGWARLRCPLPTESFHSVIETADRLQSYKAEEKLRLLSQTMDVAKLVDASRTFTAIASIVSLYRKWIGNVPQQTAFQYRLVIDNSWRVLPFFDHPQWVDFVDRCGSGLISERQLQVPPPGAEPRYFEKTSSVELHSWLGIETLLALGLPIEVALGALGAELERWESG